MRWECFIRWKNYDLFFVQHLTPSTWTAQRSIELLLSSTMRLNKSWYSALTQKLWQNTRYLQLGGTSNWLRSWQFFIKYLHSKIWGESGAFRPYQSTRLEQWLMVIWFWSSFHCNWKPVDSSRRPPKGKYCMVSEICNRQRNT